ncbi:MAG: PilZ domain-containing protein [Phycisphaerales bacterium]
MGTSVNRRRFERFSLPSAYTAIHVRTLDQDKFVHSGHTYDICEGGVQFELDYPIAPGTPIAAQIELPSSVADEQGGPGRAIYVFGNVVWLDDSEPGPVRVAMTINRYAREGDRERLIRVFAAGKLNRLAA